MPARSCGNLSRTSLFALRNAQLTYMPVHRVSITPPESTRASNDRHHVHPPNCPLRARERRRRVGRLLHRSQQRRADHPKYVGLHRRERSRWDGTDKTALGAWCNDELSNCPIICQQTAPGPILSNTCDPVCCDEKLPSCRDVELTISRKPSPTAASAVMASSPTCPSTP